MRWTRLLAIMRKEIIQIRRDRTTLSLVLGIPVLQLILFGYALNTVTDHLPTVVHDDSQTASSRAFIDAFHNTGYFDILRRVSSQAEVMQAIDDGAAKVGLIIPSDFGTKALRGEMANAQLIVDGSDPNVAQTALFAGGLVGQVHSGVMIGDILARAGSGAGNGGVDLRPIVLYNPRMLSVNFMVPGIIGLVVQMEAVILTAFAVVREREHGTLEQLVVSPVKPIELMVGKILPSALLALASVAIALLVTRLLFGVRTAGSLPLLFLMTTPFLLSGLGIGLIISVASRTQAQAQQLAQFVLLPAILLSGFLFAREGMPGLFQAIGLAIPMTYYLHIIRGIMLKGVGMHVLWPEFAALCLFSLVTLVVAAARFRKTIE
ncbi:MAG: ABC transporter permease [Dehalococcoidia bacterium]